MVDQPDGRYGYRAWDRRPGDNVDPSVALAPEEVVFEVANTAPMPLPAPALPRFFGAEHLPPTIEDVLSVAPVGGVLMNDTPTRQDSGMQGTSRYSLGSL
jgi:hypothetical protein